MTEVVPDAKVLTQAVQLACRAPSLHNSQPWRWVAEGGVLHLFADPTRIGQATDSTGREVVISCGAVLDHLRVAMAAAGWESHIDRLPDPNHRDHLATIQFSPAVFVTDAERARAEAITRRRTDRLPFIAPAQWDVFESLLRATIDASVVDLDVISDDARSELAEASRLTEDLRRYDSSYQAELRWWTTQEESPQGIPPRALLSETEARRVDVGRAFPTDDHGLRRAAIYRDRCKILVLSTHDDSRGRVLRCGEVLSTVLLESTVARLATCTLTHLIEVNASRELVRRLTGRTAEPQLLIRVGKAPDTKPPAPATPRRPVADVLEIRG